MTGAVRPAYTARAGEAIRVFRDEDGSFAVGIGRITIAADDMVFVTHVIDDFGRLVCTPAGEAVLRQGDSIGRPVRIIKPEPPTAPPNAWVLPDDGAAATAQGVPAGAGGGGGLAGGCGSTIVYDPADWPRRGDPRSPSSVEMLLLLLRQANMNALGRSDPSQPDWGTGT